MDYEIEQLAMLVESDDPRQFTNFRMTMIAKYGINVYRQMWCETLSFLYNGDTRTAATTGGQR